MAKVYFVREEISIEIPVGTSVLEAEIQAGLAPDVPCGGQGTCGKCLVKVDGKPVLACQTKVEKDCQVEIPGKKNRGKILSEGFSRKVNFQPELQVLRIWVSAALPISPVLILRCIWMCEQGQNGMVMKSKAQTR